MRKIFPIVVKIPKSFFAIFVIIFRYFLIYLKNGLLSILFAWMLLPLLAILFSFSEIFFDLLRFSGTPIILEEFFVSILYRITTYGVTNSILLYSLYVLIFSLLSIALRRISGFSFSSLSIEKKIKYVFCVQTFIYLVSATILSFTGDKSPSIFIPFLILFIFSIVMSILIILIEQGLQNIEINILPHIHLGKEDVGSSKNTTKDSVEVVGNLIQMIFLSLFIFIIMSKFYFSESKYPVDKPELDNSIAESLYRSNRKNIQFTLPKGWRADTNNIPTLPSGFSEPIIVLKKDNSACVIGVMKDDPLIPDKRKQVSFADRVHSDYEQFGGDWYIIPDDDSVKYSFSADTRQYLPGEFRMSGNRDKLFLLFMEDIAAVPDDCNDDFNALLRSIEPYYETTSLTRSSSGVLTIEKVWDDVAVSSENKSYEHLVFTADGSMEKLEVMRTPGGTWTKRFSVYEGKLYFPSFHKPSGIFIVDPFTGQTRQIPVTQKIDSFISSLYLPRYLSNGVAYYLENESSQGVCLDSRKPCPADLYSVSLIEGNHDQPTLIGQSSTGGHIVGYDKDEGALYIKKSWGDAGCAQIYISKVASGREESVDKISVCYNDFNKEDEQKLKTVETIAEASNECSKGLRVQNNTLLPANEVTSGAATFCFSN